MKWHVFVFLLVWATGALSSSGVRSVRFDVFDADSGDRVLATIFVDGEKLSDDNKLILPAYANSRLGLDVTAVSEGGYESRSFTVFLEGLSEASPIYNVYMVKAAENSHYSIGAVRRAARYISKNTYDRAVVLLERIHMRSRGGPAWSEFDIVLKYNLADAYLISCVERFVDQCGSAQAIFADLSRGLDEYPERFAKEKISKDTFDRVTRTVAEYDAKMLFRRAIWDASRQRLEDALVNMDEFLDRVSRNPWILEKMRVTNADIDRMRSDWQQKLSVASQGYD